MGRIIPASEVKDIVPNTTDQYWAALRHKGGGPVYIKVGRKVYYDTDDVAAWLAANRHTRTDKPVSA